EKVQSFNPSPAMILILLWTALLAIVAESRVTFTHSEVLQQIDVSLQKRAHFKCDNGCKVYTDYHSDLLWITKQDDQGNFTGIVSFKDTGGADTRLPEPYILPISNDYYIENRGDANPIFVFYAVDNKAPNIDTQVLVIDDEKGIGGDSPTRMSTILSSKFDSVRYSQFYGEYVSGYPRIYSTGFDAVSEKDCQPLYQSRSPESGYLAAITVFSPISTVDYGHEGEHDVLVKWNK
ncbi:hypothetical protein PENTCL1PPCAC_13445, partial [Pristionchus entomophagus]